MGIELTCDGVRMASEWREMECQSGVKMTWDWYEMGAGRLVWDWCETVDTNP